MELFVTNKFGYLAISLFDVIVYDIVGNLVDPYIYLSCMLHWPDWTIIYSFLFTKWLIVRRTRQDLRKVAPDIASASNTVQ